MIKIKVNWFEVDIDFISFEIIRHPFEPVEELRESLAKLTGFTREKWAHVVNKWIVGEFQPDSFYEAA